MAPARAEEGAGTLTTDRWQQLESLCHAALARPAAERAAFLAGACGGDETLQREVESLVAGAASAASFLEAPVGVATSASLIGRQLGVFTIEAPIGAGGMGEVYRARDTRLDRTVAVKILPRELAADANRRQRFQREARAIAGLNHPNICTIHDVGHDEGLDYLVMELVEGETLAACLANGPLPLDQALTRAIEIADALDKAHRQGIIHRDLKPGNVMLASTRAGRTHDAHVKLLDFGLARLMPSAGGGSAAPTDTTPMTEAGAVLGTLQYMAPEQIDGRPADARTDIFAFGALLYEMLTGRRAFAGDSSPRLMAAILRDDAPSLASVQPPVPPALNWLVRTCLAKDPDDRFASIHDVLLELRRIAATPADPGAAVPGGRRNLHLLWTGAALLAALGGALAGARWLNPSPSTRIARLSLAIDEHVRLPPRDLGIAVSPDGARVVFAGQSSGQWRLLTRSIDDQNVQPLSKTEGGLFPFFSPDGRWLGFFADGKLLKRSTADGSVQTIAEVGEGAGGAGVACWGADGYILFGQHGENTKEGVRRVSADGGPVEVLSRPDLASGEMVNSMPQRLPGGSVIIYTSFVRRFNGATFNVMAMPAAGGPPRVLIPGASRALALDGGRLIYQVDTSLLTATIDPQTLALGAPTTIAEGVYPNMFGGTWSVTRDVLVYRPNEGGVNRAVWVSRTGVRGPVGAPDRGYSNLRLSPEGDRIAFRIDGKDSTTSSWVYNLKAGVLSKVTPNTLSGILWSRNGLLLTVEGGEGRAMDIFQIAADGSGEPKAIVRNGQPKYSASWTPDGRTLVYAQTGDPATRSDLWAIDVEGDRAPRSLLRTPADEYGRLSPDGKWLAYVSDQTGRFELYVTPFPALGARSQISTGGAREPVWSRDGRELFYRNGTRLLAVTVRADTTFKWDPARVLFEGDFFSFAGPGNQSYDVSPDGKRFLMLEVVRPAPRLDVVQGWRGLVNGSGR